MTETTMSWETTRFVLMETFFGAVLQLRLVAMVAATDILALLAKGLDDEACPPSCRDLRCHAGRSGRCRHTQAEDGQATFSDALHLLAAGAWLGGLLDLTVVAIGGKSGADNQACEAALRFSKMGYIAVTILILSGLANSWFVVGSLTNLATTTYGQLLLLKLALFAAMFYLVGINRFFVVPALLRSAASGTNSGLRNLLFTVTTEQRLGLAVVLIINFMGVTEPAVGS